MNPNSGPLDRYFSKGTASTSSGDIKNMAKKVKVDISLKSSKNVR